MGSTIPTQSEHPEYSAGYSILKGLSTESMGVAQYLILVPEVTPTTHSSNSHLHNDAPGSIKETETTIMRRGITK